MPEKKLKILVVSNTPWRMDNSFGNTFNAYFGGMEEVEIANIYCRAGKPDASAPIARAFQITEASLIQNIKEPSAPSGREVFDREESAPIESVVFNAARKRRWQILFWGRDLIWKIGRWGSSELVEFVDSFDPDLLFLPVYYSNYLCDIDSWAIKHCEVPVFANISDDIYTLKQSRKSPLYWIDRLLKRRKIKKIADSCEVLYVISEVQQADYRSRFNTEVKVLRKGFDFRAIESPATASAHETLHILYTGNIGSGRWRSLGDVADAVSELNDEGIRALFDVYTPTPLTSKMYAAFDGRRGVTICGPVSSAEVAKIQEDADVLVHVESFVKADKCAVRHSISTKIPDYLRRGKCILAYGPDDVASVEYLKRGNSALVAASREELRRTLTSLVDGDVDMGALGKRAYAFARANHNKANIQAMLLSDFHEALKKRQGKR